MGKDGDSEGYCDDDESKLGVESEGDLDFYLGCHEIGTSQNHESH
jgi:hypothetical protein